LILCRLPLSAIAYPCPRKALSLKLLAYLTETFITTFGITRPRPEQERLTSLIIGGFLLLFLMAVFGVVGLLVYLISSR
jgi:hypothetical protein